MSGAAPPQSSQAWWRHAVVYQIYPRSFADSDGDGVGDLRGITARVPYLAALHVDAVWLSPFYPSPMVDGGYDVSDFRDVDPSLGTLEDFDALVAALHAAGIKVLVDLVANHTSSEHPWFREALAGGPGCAARARYHFRDGRGPDGGLPPTDWESFFGGSCWTRVVEPDGRPGQWYLHIFAPEQPDLNWDNEDVRDDALATLRFWSDRGVDGFRVDAAPHLAKDLSEPHRAWVDLPWPAGEDGTHPFWDRDGVLDVFREWRTVLDEYDPPRFAIAEAGVAPSRRNRYTAPESLGQVFFFELLDTGWQAGQFVAVVEQGLAQARDLGVPSTWVLSSHDVVRHATRYALPDQRGSGPRGGVVTAAKEWLLTGGTGPADLTVGLRRARAATLLALALPGSAYLYQGEELGLHEVADLPEDVLQDPAFRRSDGREKGRDGCRVPLPWTRGGPSFGFGPAAAHLPQPDWFAEVSVEAQECDIDSTLALYRHALALRRRLGGGHEVCRLDVGPDVLHLVRPGGWHSVTNFGAECVDLPHGAVLVASTPLSGARLPPDATAWVRVDDLPHP